MSPRQGVSHNSPRSTFPDSAARLIYHVQFSQMQSLHMQIVATPVSDDALLQLLMLLPSLVELSIVSKLSVSLASEPGEDVAIPLRRIALHRGAIRGEQGDQQIHKISTLIDKFNAPHYEEPSAASCFTHYHLRRLHFGFLLKDEFFCKCLSLPALQDCVLVASSELSIFCICDQLMCSVMLGIVYHSNEELVEQLINLQALPTMDKLSPDQCDLFLTPSNSKPWDISLQCELHSFRHLVRLEVYSYSESDTQ